MASYPKYKVAAVQAAPVYLDLPATVDKSVKIITEAAKQTGTFVLMTNSVYDDRLYTMLCTDEDGNLEEDRLAYFKTLKQGHTAIIGPDGNLRSDYVPSGQEGIAYADIDLEDIIDYKYGFDAAGDYRNQYLTLNFYREPHPFCNYVGDGKQEPIPYDALQPGSTEDSQE